MYTAHTAHFKNNNAFSNVKQVKISSVLIHEMTINFIFFSKKKKQTCCKSSQQKNACISTHEQNKHVVGINFLRWYIFSIAVLVSFNP